MSTTAYAPADAEGKRHQPPPEKPLTPEEARQVLTYWASLGTIGTGGADDLPDRFEGRDYNDQEQWR